MYTILYDPTDPSCYKLFFPDGSCTIWYRTLQEVLDTLYITSDDITIEGVIDNYPDTYVLVTSETPISTTTHPELFI